MFKKVELREKIIAAVTRSGPDTHESCKLPNPFTKLHILIDSSNVKTNGSQILVKAPTSCGIPATTPQLLYL